MFNGNIKKALCFDDRITFLNNGSYGAVPLSVEEAQIDFFKSINKCPAIFMDEAGIEGIRENLAAACELLDIRDVMENAALVNNVTKGVNYIFNNFNFEEGDVLITTSMIYGCYTTLIDSICKKNRINHILVDIQLKDSVSDMIGKFKEAVSNIANQKVFAFIEWIASASAKLYPVDEIIEVLHEKNCVVMIDGAHAPGQLPSSIISKVIKKSDVFIGDIHKWCFCVRGCAILVVNKANSKYFYPTIVSWYYKNDTPFIRFFNLGTEDTLSRYSVVAAKKFIESIGGLEDIFIYCSKAVCEIVSYIRSNIPGTVLAVDENTSAPFMRLISLPEAFNDCKKTRTLFATGSCDAVMRHFREIYKIDLLFVIIEKKLFLRICASVYNSIEDAVSFVEAYFKYMN